MGHQVQQFFFSVFCFAMIKTTTTGHEKLINCYYNKRFQYYVRYDFVRQQKTLRTNKQQQKQRRRKINIFIQFEFCLHLEIIVKIATNSL